MASHLAIVKRVAAQTGWSERDVRRILDAWIREVQSALSRGEPVSIREFGAFLPSEVRPRRGWNFGEGQVIERHSHPTVRFRAAPYLENLLPPGPGESSD